MAKLLLPGDWSHIAPGTGLNSINPNDFEGRLYRIANIDSAGVPSVFAHPYGFSKALGTSPPNAHAMKQFSILVRAIFLGIVDLKPYKLSIGNKLARDLQSFESRLGMMFILRWMNKTIGGVYHECFSFPGARFVKASEYESKYQPSGAHPDEDYKGITLQNLEKEVNDCTGIYGPDLVKALFKRWIEKIIQGLNRPVDQQGWPIWLQRLLDVSNNEWRTDLEAPEGSLNNFTEMTHEVQLRHMKTINLVSVRKITKHIFCKKIVEFETGEKPDIPIKAQYLPLLDIAETKFTGDSYSVKLNGWPHAFEWNPLKFIKGHQTQSLRASILYWPNFKAANWMVNYLFFVPSTVFSAYRPKLKLLSESYEALGELTGTDGCKTDRPVEFIEVILDAEPCGVFKDNRKMVGNGQTAVTLSIDFGTTHTSLGTKDANTGQYQLFNFEDMTHDRLGMRYFKDSSDDEIQNVRKSCFWFPCGSFSGGLTVLPSELVFKAPTLLPQGDEVLKDPIKNFMIPHPLIDRDLLHQITIDNFKWKDREPFTQEELIRTYLKIVLHMALGVLRRRDLCLNVALVPTYPLAFGREMHDSYKELLLGGNGNGLLSEVEKETGVKLSLAIVNSGRGLQELVTESHAAKEFCAGAEGRAEMVVDIGGGTTDIALWTNGNTLVDSIKYGANKYLDYLASKFQTYPAHIDDINERIIALQKIIRQNGIREVLKIYPAAHKSTAQQAIDRFFQGLFEYIRRMLTAADTKQVHIYPVGNGWRLIEGYVPPNNNIRDYIENWFGQSCISLNIITPADSDYKGLVAKGARRIADAQQYEHPDLNTPARTILGGVIDVNGETKHSNESVPTGPLGASPLRFNTTEFVQSLPFKPTKTVSIDVISGQFAKFCQDAIYPCPGGNYGLKKSIFAIFLETIYSNYYL